MWFFHSTLSNTVQHNHCVEVFLRSHLNLEMEIDHPSPLSHNSRKIPKMSHNQDKSFTNNKGLSNCNRQSIASTSTSAQLVDNGNGHVVNVA